MTNEDKSDLAKAAIVVAMVVLWPMVSVISCGVHEQAAMCEGYCIGKGMAAGDVARSLFKTTCWCRQGNTKKEQDLEL